MFLSTLRICSSKDFSSITSIYLCCSKLIISAE
jgi:hypothetical protein